MEEGSEHRGRAVQSLYEPIPDRRARAAQLAGVNIDVITVQAFGDGELSVAVHNALSWAAYLPDAAVSARVEAGWVTLSGTVHWGFQRQNAEDAVRYMKGVKGLTNAIVVANRSAPVADIKANIEAALRRHYDAQNQHVVVSIDDRVVTLSGTVSSWWHRYLTRNSAWNAPGVEDVRDHMRIAD